MEFQEIAWALTTFERLRISNNHSVESIFKAVNQRGTETLPVRMFAANLSMYFNIDMKKAEAISRLFDIRQQEEICVQDIKKALKKHSPSTSIEGLLADHPIFPSWLTSRPDFHEFFIEWTIENGAPNVALVEMALKAKQRSAGDLQLIFKWIKMYKILSKVSDARLLEVCKSIEMSKVRCGFNVVTQGDHGDSFYIILEGSCEVFVNHISVGTLHIGMSFGEKALENNAPRAATVTALEPCIMMVLRSSEYKGLVSSARAKEDQDIVESMHCLCPLFKEISYARLFYMVKRMVRRVYQPGEKILKQGDTAAVFVVVMSGRAEVMRRFCPTTQMQGEGGSGVRQEEAIHGQDVLALLRKARERRNIEVLVCDARAGDIVGDDTMRRKDCTATEHSYSVTASTITETILVNKEDILGYFEVRRKKQK